MIGWAIAIYRIARAYSDTVYVLVTEKYYSRFDSNNACHSNCTADAQSQPLAPLPIGLPGPTGAQFSDALSEIRLETLRNDFNLQTSDGSSSLSILPSLAWRTPSLFGNRWVSMVPLRYYRFRLDLTWLDSDMFLQLFIMFLCSFDWQSWQQYL